MIAIQVPETTQFAAERRSRRKVERYTWEEMTFAPVGITSLGMDAATFGLVRLMVASRVD